MTASDRGRGSPRLGFGLSGSIPGTDVAVRSHSTQPAGVGWPAVAKSVARRHRPAKAAEISLLQGLEAFSRRTESSILLVPQCRSGETGRRAGLKSRQSVLRSVPTARNAGETRVRFPCDGVVTRK